MNTLYFKELLLRNFMSFGQNETVVDLTESGTFSIEGQNLDQGGSNGAGKTSIINAICYALFNKPFDNISLQKLINSTNASKNTLMEVRLTFERDGHDYEILRTRGEQFTIRLTKDGEDITPGKSVTECDTMIQDIIGVSYELFTHTIIFSGNSPAFLQLPIAQQRNLIEELFNITLLSRKSVKLKDLVRQTESDIKIQEAVVKQQELAVELHEKHISDAQGRVERWERERVAEISKIEHTLAVIGSIDFELEQALHDEKNSLTQEGSYLATKLAPLRKDKTLFEREVQKLLDEELHLKDAKCPYCAQDFADAEAKRKTVAAALEQKGSLLISTTDEVHAFETRDAERKARLREVEARIQHANLKELLLARENAASLRQKVEELKVSENPHIEALEKLLGEVAVQVEYNKIDDLKKRLEHQQFLLKLLTSKDSFLRRKIINKTLPFLNERINKHTAGLGLPHIVKFDADLSCTVAEFGRELEFGNLSAGEKKRVNIGMALAFREVLHHLHAKCNLLLIDELDGQLDGSGIDAIVRILKDKSRDEELAIYVISHHPNISGRLDRNLVVQKQHGFSQIVEE